MLNRVLPALLGVLVLCSVARAESPVGFWKSSAADETLIVFPQVKDSFLLLWHSKAGDSIAQAQWVKDLEGTQFTYKGGPTNSLDRTGTISAKNPDEIKLVDEKGAALRTLKRTDKLLKPGPQAGLWKSASGSTFFVAPEINGAIPIVQWTPDQKVLVLSAAWVEGLKDTQFAWGPDGAKISVTLNAKEPNKAHGKSSDGTDRVWERSLAWPTEKADAKPEAKIAATWKAPSGETLVIPETEAAELDVTWTSADGRTIKKLAAKWTTGFVGTQLEAKDGAHTIVCTFSAKNPGILNVKRGSAESVTFQRQ